MPKYILHHWEEHDTVISQHNQCCMVVSQNRGTPIYTPQKKLNLIMETRTKVPLILGNDRMTKVLVTFFLKRFGLGRRPFGEFSDQLASVLSLVSAGSSRSSCCLAGFGTFVFRLTEQRG